MSTKIPTVDHQESSTMELTNESGNTAPFVPATAFQKPRCQQLAIDTKDLPSLVSADSASSTSTSSSRSSSSQESSFTPANAEMLIKVLEDSQSQTVSIVGCQSHKPAAPNCSPSNEGRCVERLTSDGSLEPCKQSPTMIASSPSNDEEGARNQEMCDDVARNPHAASAATLASSSHCPPGGSDETKKLENDSIDNEYDQEDHAVTELERSGAITQVIGSQSILSQEICFDSNFRAEDAQQEENGKGKDMVKLPELVDGTADAVSKLPATSDSDQAKAAARRYGLLLMDCEDDEDDQGEKKIEAQPEVADTSSGAPKPTPPSSVSTIKAVDVATDSAENKEQSSQQTLSQLDLSQLSQDMAAANLSQHSKEGELWTVARHETQRSALEAEAAAALKVSALQESQAALSTGTNFDSFATLLEAVDRVQAVDGPPTAGQRGGRRKKPEKLELKTQPKVKTEQIPNPVESFNQGGAWTKQSESPDSLSRKRKKHGLDVATPTKKKGRKTAKLQTPDHVLAHEAADLAKRVIDDEQLAKQLLLSMVMERQPTRQPPKFMPPAGTCLPDGFVWSQYPPLERILRDNMTEYYELSLQKRQSAAQQTYNNWLVQEVREIARDQQGWTFDLTDRALRDRIRCYYKTHIQNAKKRLQTMLKNPTKQANARHLIHHLHLIQETLKHKDDASNDEAGESNENTSAEAENMEPTDDTEERSKKRVSTKASRATRLVF